MSVKLSEKASQRITQLRQRYYELLPAKKEALESAWEQAKESPTSEELALVFKGLVHKLAGSGVSYGLPQLGVAAAALDALLQGLWQSGTYDADASVYQSLQPAWLRLRESLGQSIQIVGVDLVALDAEKVPSDAPVIMVVDDDEAVLSTLSLQLEALGFVVKTYLTPEDAAQEVATVRPSAMLVDLMFPQLGSAGYDFVREARLKLDYHVPVFFISSLTDFNARFRASQVGGDGYFAKPVNVFALATALHEFTDRGNYYRVLLVEDDVEQAGWYSAVLSDAGCAVRAVGSAEDVLAACGEFRPELVLVDLVMPGHDGADIARVLRQHEQLFDIPIVFMSVSSTASDKSRAIAAGADAFLSKVDDGDYLVELVRGRIQRYRRVQRSVTQDKVTGVLNRYALIEAVERSISMVQRAGGRFSLAMLDIDNFKNINDTLGHLAGDAVLKFVAERLRLRLRRSDIIGRYGGDELMVFAQGASADEFAVVLEDVRQGLEVNPIALPGSENVTVSISLGVVGVDTAKVVAPAHSTDFYAAQADEMLYQAKRSGKNRICKRTIT
ncbi:MAG: diguanylate cyclase [Gammaproteobacteria bacterium]|nr:diguanylate cyclase [Gammaproteobacteria bacterium]